MAEVKKKATVIYTLILDEEEFETLIEALKPKKIYALTPRQQDILDNIYVVSNGMR